MAFLSFMNRPLGRLVRVVAGGALIVWGFGFSGGPAAGLALGVVGLLPLAMGLWGRCLPQFCVGHTPAR